ncbi:cupin domain-containing protein [Achromobacter arsenitoxydans]|uniref:Cupin n=1 Tax=Achromobacter arsenitoxydans SY8 TaxID=477184 RepID=H0FF76_9BURK|nr:cupin domain-containing protein [Achromobacter arsenitoxydans]EHK63184.1 cupin [Achromobacter arsenitoxydans SY8]
MSKTTKFGLPFIAAAALLSQPAWAASHHAPGVATPAEPIVTELMTKDLPDIPGKDALMLIVDYPPGGADPVHRHDAYGFVYVLEGSIVMQVKGGKEVTLTPGQTYYEGPDDIHTVGRNASQTQPAKFLVVLIKKQGAPALIPIK